MSKLTLTDAVKVIPLSESILRRDLKIGKSPLKPMRKDANV